MGIISPDTKALRVTTIAANLYRSVGFLPKQKDKLLGKFYLRLSAYQKYLEDPLAEFILGENPDEGSVLEAQLNKSKDGIKIALKKTAKSDIKE